MSNTSLQPSPHGRTVSTTVRPTDTFSTYWTFWAPIPEKSNQNVYGPVYDFNTIEQFWSLYNSLNASRLLQNPSSERVEFLFFRSLVPDIATIDPETGKCSELTYIAPAWEHALNAGGGEFRILLNNPESSEKQWLYTLLSIIGGSLPYSETVTGIWLVHSRNSARLSVWTSGVIGQQSQQQQQTQSQQQSSHHDQQQQRQQQPQQQQQQTKTSDQSSTTTTTTTTATTTTTTTNETDDDSTTTNAEATVDPSLFGTAWMEMLKSHNLSPQVCQFTSHQRRLSTTYAKAEWSWKL